MLRFSDVVDFFLHLLSDSSHFGGILSIFVAMGINLGL